MYPFYYAYSLLLTVVNVKLFMLSVSQVDYNHSKEGFTCWRPLTAHIAVKK